jgi:hypothetical protein
MTITGIPQGTLFTRYVLENPWPAGIGLVFLGVALLFIAIQRDDRRMFLAAVSAIAVAGIVLLTGFFFETTAESAANATRELVKAAEEGRTHDIIATLEPDATLHFGSPNNPGQPIDELQRDINTLDDSNRIVSNSLNNLTFASADSTTAVTAFACMTTTELSYGPFQSKWEIEWQRDEKGIWRIRRLTVIEIAGRTPRGLR